jgi:magnesium-protoporphyrin O-methyltransferase
VTGGRCDPRGCEQFFGSRFASFVARRYRRRGLDRTARRMVEFLEERGIQGATVLEIGGGVGEIQIELLRRGAARATNLELSGGYDQEASALLAAAGLAGRAERRLHDIAEDPGGVPPADVVVLHRVVCCYPDYQRLLAAAGDHARRLLVFSYPPYRPGRLAFAAQNLFFRLRGMRFRVYAHPPARMLAVLGERGLRRTLAHRGFVWRIAGLERA